MAYKDFTEMPVWQKAFSLLVEVYRLSKSFPKEERYGMISDIRRSANSVTHNIAEGFGRYEKRDKTRFYKISRGSAYEIISQSFVSEALEYLTKEESENLIIGYREVIDELDSMIKSIENRDN
ncbi:MAG: four helix bundle protein [Bacteroidetes bacterium]|nr:four helix bundle protein [Bacteroidota bacterium]MBL7103441.1 four helix bundle protein [Bacteroidales bacterium]